MGGARDRASVGYDVLARQILFQFKNKDVVIAVLVCIANGEVPNPEVSKALTDREILVVASTVLDDSNVARLSSGGALIVGLERVVLLIDDNVRGVVAGEFTNFDEFYIGKFVPVCISALITSHPNVLSFTEIAVSVVPQNSHGMGSVRGDGQIVVAVAVEIANGDVGWVTVGCICSSHRSA